MHKRDNSVNGLSFERVIYEPRTKFLFVVRARHLKGSWPDRREKETSFARLPFDSYILALTYARVLRSRCSWLSCEFRTVPFPISSRVIQLRRD